MGFSVDPGPLPFVTIRERDKWGPRLTGIDVIDLQCDNGAFTMPETQARIVKIEDYRGWCPIGLQSIYGNRPLIAVHLASLMSPQKRVG